MKQRLKAQDSWAIESARTYAGVVDQVTADEIEADALYVVDSTLKTGARMR